MTRVLVTGGTGLLGGAVVQRLLAAGHEVRVLSRDPAGVRASLPRVDVRQGDLREPVGLEGAVAGTDAVVHCATDPRSADEVDVAGTAHLLRALRSADVGHLVHVSIVGVDQVPLRFYRAKLLAESYVEDQDVPWTIQRATQFHPFLDGMLARSTRLPVVPCPRGLRFQPVAVEDVAARLVDHVTAGPSGRAPDLGGPEVLSQRELAATWLRAHRRHRVLVSTPLPGKLGAAFRRGANLCPDQASGGATWREYLAHSMGDTVPGRQPS